MRILLTAGPTYEPIDPVRYIGNRSSGKLGAALAFAIIATGHHELTLILGPTQAEFPEKPRRIDVQTAREMQDAILREFPSHDLLIMAAAVADYRVKKVSAEKLPREDAMSLELEPTEDIVAAAGRIKRPDQRTVGFSLETSGDLARAREKMARKRLDLIVLNSPMTLGSDEIQATLLHSNGKERRLPSLPKLGFAGLLLGVAIRLFGDK